MAGSRRPHYHLTFAILAIGSLSYALLQSLVAPALPTMQKELHSSTTGAAWIFTSYLLSFSVVTPIAGRLGDMFGKKRVLVIALAAVAVGCLVSAVAHSLVLMVVGRVIQGIGGGVFPLSFGIVRDEFPRERVASGIAMISAILGVGSGLGIALAGPIIDGLSYHWLFWFPMIVVALGAVAALLVIPESPVRAPGRVSWLGAGLLSAWLVCLLVAVSEGPTWGWGSTRAVGLFAAAAALTLLWVRTESRSAQPLVDMRMMRLRGVWTTNLTTLLLAFGLYASFVLIPEFVEMPKSTGYGFGASVTQAGLFLLPATVTMLFASILAGRLANAVNSKVPFTVGTLVTGLAFAALAAAHDHGWEMYVVSAMMGIGIGLAYASMANLIVESVPPEQTGVASGMNTIMRSAGGAVGAEVVASILAGTLTASGLPAERGFTIGFAVCAAAILVGVVASLRVPSHRGAIHVVAAPATSAD